MDSRPDFSMIVRDNEAATAAAFKQGQYVQACLFVHALTEALLRLFLRQTEGRATFNELISAYQSFLQQQGYPLPTFIEELTQFNRLRNRMVHQLWRRGYFYANARAEGAARGAVQMYGLLIEWLDTFDSEITKVGFEYDKGT